MPWQPTSALYPDAELLLTGAYRTLLQANDRPDVYVSNRVPTQRRDRMLVLNRDGGTPGELLDRPRMRMRVWAPKAQDATDLAREVAALAGQLVTRGDVLYATHISGPLEVPDDAGRHQRYLLFEFGTDPLTTPEDQ